MNDTKLQTIYSSSVFEHTKKANLMNFYSKTDETVKPGTEAGSKKTLGKEIIHKDKKYCTYTDLPENDSALITFYPWQRNLLYLVTFALIGLFILNPLNTIIVFLSILTLIYFTDLIFSTSLLYKSLHFPPEVSITNAKIKQLQDEKLPVYTILCPLYKEAEVLPQFVESINAIDWPKEKLDVLLLLEEDDLKTQEKARELNLPPHFKIVVVPHSSPKTKPKACNFGLGMATGEYVVIYDAEDRPDPMQLKTAYLAFHKVDENVACLQSKLNYYNNSQNLLTKLFTAEYSLWFDLILPGLQHLETTIPLGGTSNHFKTDILRKISAWDPFNVTEDCDLGTRLFRRGYKTAIINSTTYEEANSQIKSWIKQRSRWIKGYLQTYLVHMRNPVAFYRKQGVHALIFQLIIGLRMSFILINPIFWLMTFLYFAFRSSLGAYIELFYSGEIYYIATFCLVFGNFVYFYNYMIGLAKRRQWDLIKYVFFVPFYWILSSVSAVIAFYQLIIKPYYWEKTQHGMHLLKSGGIFPKVRILIDTNFPFNVGKLARSISESYYSILRTLYDLMDLFAELPSMRNPKKGKHSILIFNWRDTKHVWAGGAETYIQEIAKRWVKTGHSVTIFTSWDRKTSRNEIVDNVLVIRRGGFFTVYVFAFLYYVFRFRGKFDAIVDCENGIPFFSNLYSRVPNLLVIHHVHREVFKKYLSYPISLIGNLLESYLMPYVYRFTPIVTVSESSKKDIVGSGLSDGDQVKVINPGVEMTDFMIGEKTKYPSFIYFGRLKEYKNIEHAIYAFSEIHKKYPQAKLDIVGYGETFDRLLNLRADMGLEDSVSLWGRANDKMRSEFLARSWAAIQPSSFEGWGITVIEANASATPVIASDVNGLRDSVVNGETGILFQPGNINELVRSMDKIITDFNFRKSISINAYYWAQKFTWEESASKFMGILDAQIEIVESHKFKYQFISDGI